jgi:hypothetical protein
VVNHSVLEETGRAWTEEQLPGCEGPAKGVCQPMPLVERCDMIVRLIDDALRVAATQHHSAAESAPFGWRWNLSSSILATPGTDVR